MDSPRRDSATEFLTVADAAAALGVSRLRIRQAAALGALTSRRDNEGRLRVDIADSLTSPPARHALEEQMTAELPPADMIGVLFDEIEDADVALDQRDAQIHALQDLLARQERAMAGSERVLTSQAGDIARLSALVDRHAQALGAADAALTASEQRETALSDLLDRAMARLEVSGTATERLTSVVDRAMLDLEHVGDGLEDSLKQTARFEALLTRALAVAEQQGDGTALGPATDRAFDMLEHAVATAEAEQAVSARTVAMLDRALASGEEMQDEIARNRDVIAAQERKLDQVLDMSERAVAAAAVSGRGAAQPSWSLRAALKKLLGI